VEGRATDTDWLAKASGLKGPGSRGERSRVKAVEQQRSSVAAQQRSSATAAGGRMAVATCSPDSGGTQGSAGQRSAEQQCKQTRDDSAPVGNYVAVDDGGGSRGGRMSQQLQRLQVPQGRQRHSAKNATRARALLLLSRH
jgi:hypothetical protein